MLREVGAISLTLTREQDSNFSKKKSYKGYKTNSSAQIFLILGTTNLIPVHLYTKRCTGIRLKMYRNDLKDVHLFKILNGNY